jgi:3-oxoacyl-[acyl-carrier-protein] synthase-3
MSMRSIIKGFGAALPVDVVTNNALEAKVQTTDQWIRERTGITQRHIAGAGETTSSLATEAAREALRDAGLKPEDIDGVVVATATPDSTMPSVATLVQAALELPAGAALDVAAACSGFVYALQVAHGWIQGGLCRNVLVIGAETMSRILDWEDRRTCILFGDGAGAVVLSAAENVGKRGIRTFALKAEGVHGKLLGTKGGVSTTQTAGQLFMSGQEVFRHGVDKMSEVTLEALAKAGLTLSDVDWVVAHQANARMLSAIAKKLDIPEAKMAVSVDIHANTSAASIPLALNHLAKQGKLKEGQILALPALGAGLTWGCCIIQL